MSNAVDRPVWPLSRRNLNRRLVSSGEPKPANMRIVHGLPRYIVACGPRVYGYCPGSPSFSAYDQCALARSSGVYVGLSGMPLIVLNSGAVSGFFTGGIGVHLPRDRARDRAPSTCSTT